MSALVIALIVLGALLVIFFVGGLIASRKREAQQGQDYSRHVAAADHALEEARAADKGWDRALLEEAARRSLEAERPGWRYDELHLVLVDDRPGQTEDRAHVVATSADGEARIVLARRGETWVPDRVE